MPAPPDAASPDDSAPPGLASMATEELRALTAQLYQQAEAEADLTRYFQLHNQLRDAEDELTRRAAR